MRFQVPQFIEVEDQIFGPLTFKQFVYVAGGGGLSYVVWDFLPLPLALPLMFLIVSFSSLLAFYQFNGRPFISVLESAFKYLLSDKLYLWKKSSKKKPRVPQKAGGPKEANAQIPRLTGSRISKISLALDVESSETEEKQ